MSFHDVIIVGAGQAGLSAGPGAWYHWRAVKQIVPQSFFYRQKSAQQHSAWQLCGVCKFCSGRAAQGQVCQAARRHSVAADDSGGESTQPVGKTAKPANTN